MSKDSLINLTAAAVGGAATMVFLSALMTGFDMDVFGSEDYVAMVVIGLVIGGLGGVLGRKVGS